MKKAVLIAPFWGNPKHVGVYRVQRIINWLLSRDYSITIIGSGPENTFTITKNETELIVKDILKLNVTPVFAANNQTGTRKPNKFRKFLAEALLLPDAYIIWALVTGFNKKAIAECRDADFILATSPPEASHIASYLLSYHSKVPFIMDMRDGWVDEPLKPFLQKYRSRILIESLLEKFLIKRARLIFVTSQGWKDQLLSRLKIVADKIVVLTNGYPEYIPLDKPQCNHHEIIYAGNLSASSIKRDPKVLFSILQQHLDQIKLSFNLSFFGNYSPTEKEVIANFNDSFCNKGWNVQVFDYIERSSLMIRMENAAGLILFSASENAIPSKFFEYIILQKPILVLAPQNSAVWNIAKNLPQCYIVDYANAQPHCSAVISFFNEACTGKFQASVPEEFSLSHLKKVFFQAVSYAIDTAPNQEKVKQE